MISLPQIIRELEQKVRSKLQLYGKIIDSYRLRMEDEYTLADQVQIGNIYYSGPGEVLLYQKSILEDI